MTAVMVDWLELNCHDPFNRVIHGGTMQKATEDGEVLWTSVSKKQFEGSWQSSLMCRNVVRDAKRMRLDPGKPLLPFWLGGNPAKFFQGHNLFGSDNVKSLAAQMISAVGDALDEPRPCDLRGLDEATIARIDLTGHWLLRRESDVLPFLNSLKENVHCPYKGAGVHARNDPGTVYFGYSDPGQRAKDWQLKLYAKGRELKKRPLPSYALAVPGLLDDINRTIRVELTLRTAELKKLDLRKVGDWGADTPRQIWEMYTDKLDFGEETMNLDRVDEMGLKPRLTDAIHAWQGGADLRLGRPKASFYRLRKEIRDATGFDISVPCPKSNVVPMRRVIEFTPALQPLWADALTTALHRVA